MDTQSLKNTKAETKSVPTGRPREWNRERVGEALLKWAEKDDSVNLNAFCAMHSIVPYQISEWARDDKQFQSAYMLTKAWIAARREKRNDAGEMSNCTYSRNAAVYDYFIDQHDRECKTFEAGLKKDVESSVTQAHKDSMDALLTQIQGLRDAKK